MSETLSLILQSQNVFMTNYKLLSLQLQTDVQLTNVS